MENKQTIGFAYTNNVYVGWRETRVITFDPIILASKHGYLELSLTFIQRQNFYQLVQNSLESTILFYDGVNYFACFNAGFANDAYQIVLPDGGLIIRWKNPVVATNDVTIYKPANKEEVVSHLKEWANQWGLGDHNDDVNSYPIEMSSYADFILDFKNKENAEILSYAQKLGIVSNLKLAARLRKSELLETRVEELESELKKLTTKPKPTEKEIEYMAQCIYNDIMRYKSR